MPDRPSPLRARRRAETQREIQGHAVRLFTERGYDATTVSDVAEAAGVSTMTVYRHFPTKEDLVLADGRDRLVAECVAAGAADRPLVPRIGRALVEAARTLTAGEAGAADGGKQFLLARLKLMIATPALRAKHLDSNYTLEQAIVTAFGDDAPDPFRAHAATSACLAAMNTALVRWAEDDGRSELPDLIADALRAAFGDHVLDDA